MHPQSLPWREPLELAAALDKGERFVLLYSGVRESYSGRYSYLARDLAECIESTDFASFGEALARTGGRWFGYFGYELKHCVEFLPADPPNWLRLPPLTMMRFDSIYRFDHDRKELALFSVRPAGPLPPVDEMEAIYPWRVSSIHSNMSRAAYLQKVEGVIAAIQRGDLYQANLTRKFMGEFDALPQPLAMFRRLCEVSPAPYSAFLRLDDTCILSSSPELFLKIDADGHMQTRPIKGTSPRFQDSAADAVSREALAVSEKERAENLMIVDLMRNDLSRACVPGSVHVERLFEVTSHAQVHHMSSTISGVKRIGCASVEAIRQCFPPGSMTGAPKVRAMRLCSELEHIARGPYSGAIGWVDSDDGSCELSVVIRTLLLQGKRFEFQVGGGIVADSTPQGEWQETIDKSRGMLTAIGLSVSDIGF